MGAIQSASGNRSVEAWAVDRLRVQYYIFSYASLLKLHGDAALLRQLDGLLGNEALLQLQLRTLAPVFKDSKRREWFLEVIDNYFKLWEVNMWSQIATRRMLRRKERKKKKKKSLPFNVIHVHVKDVRGIWWYDFRDDSADDRKPVRWFHGFPLWLNVPGSRTKLYTTYTFHVFSPTVIVINKYLLL